MQKSQEQSEQKAKTETKKSAEVVLDQKVNEVLLISTLFYVMNESKWNVFDDDFYLVKRGWFEAWKKYICYDYILLKHVTEQRKIQELSLNKIVYESNQYPGYIGNNALTLKESQIYQKHLKEGLPSSTPLKEGQIE